MKLKHFLKSLFQIISHMELAEATALILANDGKQEIALFFNEVDGESGKKFIEFLVDGTQDADQPLSGGYILTLCHFHHPWTHRGYLVGKSSADEITAIFTTATTLWQEEKTAEAIYQLGRALHLLQDIFIPHHSGITGVKGHGELEKWLTENWLAYQTTSGGYYQWEEDFYHQNGHQHHVSSTNPYDWIDYGSHLSIEWYEQYFAVGTYDENTFRTVAPRIVSNALRFSAGFINFFFEQAVIAAREQ
ncbi:MAG TPA: zinc dependent phospholipase C family protein [Oscillospiraceae bacterium]|nr:zinc dependent phospholipase C family protein [Oscillospiraceae bacterium]